MLIARVLLKRDKRIGCHGQAENKRAKEWRK
jgi:hypothetical protein